MKNLKTTTVILSIGIFPGFIIGFFLSGFMEALDHVTANRYFFYKAYRLVVSIFLEPFFKWLVVTIMASLLFFLVILLVEKLYSRLSNKNKKILKIILIGMVWAVLFIGVGWAVNHYWIPYTKFHPLSLLADVGILLVSVFLVRLTVKISGKIQWKALFHRLAEKRLINIKTAAVALLFLLLLLNIGAFLYVKIQTKEGPNVVFIVIDALRQDHLGCYGYRRNTSPHIDALAQEGVFYKNAYSSSPWTKPSVASFLTALYPNNHRAISSGDMLPENVLTISEIFKNEGCCTFFLGGGNTYIGKRFQFHQGFDSFFNERINAARLTDQFLSLIPKLKKRRFFAYIHYMDVHLPYKQNKYYNFFVQNKGTHHFEPGNFGHKDIKRLMISDTLSMADREYLIALYDGQIRFVDENIERILSMLKSYHMLNDTLVVVTSDHGEEFWDHDHFEHGHSLYDELIRIPLIIAGNKMKPSEIKDPVRSIDLLPIVLEIVGMKANSYKLEEIRLLNTFNRENSEWDHSIFAMGTLRGDEKYCLIHQDRKLIVNTGNKTRKAKLIGYKKKRKFEFYDITRDPLEKENLADMELQEVSRLKMVLDEFIKAKSIFKSKEAILDKKTKERLKSLGYL
jgi:arylsulfatase A-like enzyme